MFIFVKTLLINFFYKKKYQRFYQLFERAIYPNFDKSLSTFCKKVAL